ncbi:hypothetical protein BaRGS_00013871 [Batillaria attramentaria]|uniref:Vps72/YL1 C-terminal domain-containing protein n=1 Tax=Batillaria attramentaria TaxID=370345 RepID=A0ABD0L6J9_9CAEN
MATVRKSSRVRVPTAIAMSPAKKRRSTGPTTPAPTTTAAAVPAVTVTTAETVPAEIFPGSNEDSNTTIGETADDTTGDKTSAVFKDPNFVHSSIGAAGSKRTRVWKNLKQIVATERSLPWQRTDVTYSSLDAPPSFKPARKYSDLSGLSSKYTDPQTKIRFANAEEFTRARMLPSDLVTGYLALRKASGPVP